MLRSLSIGKRITTILALMLLFIGGTCLAFLQSFETVKDVSTTEIDKLMYQGQEAKLKVATDGLAVSLSHVLKDLDNADAQHDLLNRALSEHRYENDDSGYFFVLDGTVMIAHISSSLIGKDLGDIKDKNGVRLIYELNQVAQNGGGYVEYIWPKPEAGDQPKLSYATRIPGTNYALGTGVYIDNIQREKDRIGDTIKAIVMNRTVTVLTSLAILLSGVLILSYLIVRSILLPIKEATAAAETIAEGEYDVRLEVKGNDEASKLQSSLNSMAATLRDNIKKITTKSAEAEDKALAAERAMAEAAEARAQAEVARKEGIMQAANRIQGVVDRVSTASQQIATQASIIDNGMNVQRSRVQETATAMEQMNATVLEVARNASEASSHSDQAQSLAEKGAATVSDSVTAMNTTYTAAEDLKSGMNRLGQQADDIGQVMEVITDIADQTNLLALNAAIEAARAGEAGRGFAVVADEVRKLAEKTMQATKEVGDSITSIQGVAQQNISGMERALTDLGKAVEMSSESGEVLADIVNGSKETAMKIQGIATAAEEQSATSEEINRAIDEINTISAETAEGAREASQSVNDMTTQMEDLQHVIDELMNDARS